VSVTYSLTRNSYDEQLFAGLLLPRLTRTFDRTLLHRAPPFAHCIPSLLTGPRAAHRNPPNANRIPSSHRDTLPNPLAFATCSYEYVALDDCWQASRERSWAELSSACLAELWIGHGFTAIRLSEQAS